MKQENLVPSSSVFLRKACPFLPPVTRVIRVAEMKRFGGDRGVAFYEGALECAQSLWLEGLSAQSILLINRAFSADLRADEVILEKFPLPYAAMVWVMSRRNEGDFIGNPRRHFQHLATRMVEPRRELRSWRAWACWVYACRIFPSFPADERQLREEQVAEPDHAEIYRHLLRLGLPGEAAEWERRIPGRKRA